MTLETVLVLAGTELIFFSVAAAFCIWYENKVDNIEFFNCC